MLGCLNAASVAPTPRLGDHARAGPRSPGRPSRGAAVTSARTWVAVKKRLPSSAPSAFCCVRSGFIARMGRHQARPTDLHRRKAHCLTLRSVRRLPQNDSLRLDAAGIRPRRLAFGRRRIVSKGSERLELDQGRLRSTTTPRRRSDGAPDGGGGRPGPCIRR